MNRRTLYALIVAFSAVAANAGVASKENVTRELPITGSFWLDNPLGSIEVTGSDVERAIVTAVKTVYAADKAALDDAREQCAISWEGNERVRLVRTLVRPVPNARCAVAYTVQLPRNAELKVSGKACNIQLRNLNGSVTVNNFVGTVMLSAVFGPSAVELVNGRIVYDFPRPPIANAQSTIINGDVDVYVPSDANFEWVASTLAGDLLTTMPVRGNLIANIFHGHFNSPGGPTLNTHSVLGRVRVLARGTTREQARSVRIPGGERVSPPTAPVELPVQKFQLPYVANGFTFDFPERIIDVSVGEVRGSAKVQTAAGEIELGVVQGNCDVATDGGPLNIGEVMGGLQARTGAGDILIRAARLGGDVRTNGGAINLLYTGGPTTLKSGGGDIVVRQAAAAVNAQTPSGDISITVDPNVKTQKIYARTEKGNVTLNLTPKFAADIDATIVTSMPDANAIHSDFTTLTIRRQQISGGRTRIHATGKINGGGDRIEVSTENGDITITSQAPAPVSVIQQ